SKFWGAVHIEVGTLSFLARGAVGIVPFWFEGTPLGVGYVTVEYNAQLSFMASSRGDGDYDS
ncbi:MAG: hypothetical protein ACI362_03880, partial [Coriobacteriales bacterium]